MYENEQLHTYTGSSTYAHRAASPDSAPFLAPEQARTGVPFRSLPLFPYPLFAAEPPRVSSAPETKKPTMVKENDVIAIIIIILFIVLAAIAFGIYRLVHVARNQGSLMSTSSSGSTEEIA
ncbi:hypothetical protein F4802DRAFT_599234 [Xylaria palmicola]|nr:hypothetical protein F4802DRAFT_599234 [Xylaria palmicola]